MFLPTNQRSAIFAAAQWLFRHGAANAGDLAVVLRGKFSERSITASCAQMKRELMADELPNGLLQLRPHVVKFLAGCEPQSDQPPAPVLASPYRPPFRELNVANRPRRGPIRAGSDDYKNWPSAHAPFTKGGAQ